MSKAPLLKCILIHWNKYMHSDNTDVLWYLYLYVNFETHRLKGWLILTFIPDD